MLKKLLTLQCYKIKTTGITMLENKNYWHYNVRKTTYITMLENKNYLHYNVRK
jgi:tRNA(Glu) U13 pseudouridine synthase TruD